MQPLLSETHVFEGATPSFLHDFQHVFPVFFFKVVCECDCCVILTNFEPQLEILWEALFKELLAFEGNMSAKSEVGQI